MHTRSFGAARAALALLVLLAGLLVAPTGAAAQRLYFTTAADHDVYSVNENGSGLTRHTKTIGNKDLNENYPTARKGTLLYETRVLRSTAVFFGGIWYFASGSHYEVIQQKGKKATLPFYKKYTSGRLPNGRRYLNISAPAFAPKGALRVAVNCTTPGVKNELCVYNYATRKLTRLTNCDCVASGGTPVRLSWSRNGRFIVFAASQEIYGYDLKRKRLTRVFDASRRADTAGEFYSHATVDPSGTKVALQYTDGASASGIRIIDLGTGRRTLIPSPEFQLVPGPNGDSIVKPGNYYAAPSFSPNGKRLAITVADGYNPDNQPLDHPAGIYSIDLDGDDFRLIQRVGRTDFNSTGYGWSLTWGS